MYDINGYLKFLQSVCERGVSVSKKLLGEDIEVRRDFQNFIKGEPADFWDDFPDIVSNLENNLVDLEDLYYIIDDLELLLKEIYLSNFKKDFKRLDKDFYGE